MGTQNLNTKIWAATIQRVMEDNLIGRKICNAEYEGKIKEKGDSIYFPGLAEPTVGKYNGTVNYEKLQDSRVTLIVDQQDYFAFKVGDIEKVQADIDTKGSQAQRSAYAMKKSADSFIMGMYTQAGQVLDAMNVTTVNVLSALAMVNQRLEEANVNDEDRWIVIPPWVRTKLLLAGIKFQINNGIHGTGGVSWTKELGFDLYVTNQVVNTGTAVTPVSQIMGGSYNSIAFATQLTETEDLRLQDSFDTAVRGLNTYGGKVIRPNELVTIPLTYVADTTI